MSSTESKASSFIFSSYGGDDAWCTCVGACEKQSEAREGASHVPTVTAIQHGLAVHVINVGVPIGHNRVQILNDEVLEGAFSVVEGPGVLIEAKDKSAKGFVVIV